MINFFVTILAYYSKDTKKFVTFQVIGDNAPYIIKLIIKNKIRTFVSHNYEKQHVLSHP